MVSKDELAAARARVLAAGPPPRRDVPPSEAARNYIDPRDARLGAGAREVMDESGPKAVNRAAHAYYNNRINALVALCEEVLTEHASTLSIVEAIFGPMGPMLDEIAAKTPEYRARLAALEGAG